MGSFQAAHLNVAHVHSPPKIHRELQVHLIGLSGRLGRKLKLRRRISIVVVIFENAVAVIGDAEIAVSLAFGRMQNG